MTKKIDVDTRTFVRFWLVLLGFVFVGFLVWKALVGIIIVGIAAFLAIAMRPLAHKIEGLTKKENPTMSSALAYLLTITVIGVIFAVIGPVVIGEVAQFAGQLPGMFNDTLGGWDGINEFGKAVGIADLQREIFNSLQTFSTNFVSNLGDTIMSGVGTISQFTTNLILTLVLTLLFMIEGSKLVDEFWKTLEHKYRKTEVKSFKHVAERMANVVGIYVSRQVMVAILDGCVVTVVVFLLSVISDFSSALALPMGLVAMVFYLIPMFGPIISCIVITLILLFSSPLAAVIFLIFYIIYEQIENNLIAPKIQGGALNLPVSVVLVAIIIGMYMFGLLGAIIAIPIAGCIKVLFEELPNLREMG